MYVSQYTKNVIADMTDDHIRAMQAEAREHGDEEMEGLCDWALQGDEAARFIVGRALADARAMDDDDS
jgi:hypothetical protein